MLSRSRAPLYSICSCKVPGDLQHSLPCTRQNTVTDKLPNKASGEEIMTDQSSVSDMDMSAVHLMAMEMARFLFRSRLQKIIDAAVPRGRLVMNAR